MLYERNKYHFTMVQAENFSRLQNQLFMIDECFYIFTIFILLKENITSLVSKSSIKLIFCIKVILLDIYFLIFFLYVLLLHVLLLRVIHDYYIFIYLENIYIFNFQYFKDIKTNINSFFFQQKKRYNSKKSNRTYYYVKIILISCLFQR